jgi:hypothetical protein
MRGGAYMWPKPKPPLLLAASADGGLVVPVALPLICARAHVRAAGTGDDALGLPAGQADVAHVQGAHAAVQGLCTHDNARIVVLALSWHPAQCRCWLAGCRQSSAPAVSITTGLAMPYGLWARWTRPWAVYTGQQTVQRRSRCSCIRIGTVQMHSSTCETCAAAHSAAGHAWALAYLCRRWTTAPACS